MKDCPLDKEKLPQKDTEYCFWESEAYKKWKSCQFFKENVFKFLDHGAFYYSSFSWVGRWIRLISREYVEPYKLYPLPVSDQILYWQPIFSKHVSDALVRLDLYESYKSDGTKKNKPYRSVLMRALVRTFWKRILFILVGSLGLCICNMSLTFIVKRILYLLTYEDHRLFLIFGLCTSLAFLQIFIGLCLDHLNFYMYRLIHIIQYSFSITIFQHGFCYRRKFSNNINGANSLNVCNEVVHSFSPDSECSKNPLFCPARRHQNKDINSRIFSFEFMDSYYISLFIESIVYILHFIFSSIFGFWFISSVINIEVWPMYVFYISTIFLMIIIEIFNTVILKYIYGLKDYRINKSGEIISGLDVIEKMFMDDIAHNVITKTRNDELILVLLRFVLSFINRLFVEISSSFSIIYFLDSLIEDEFKLNDITRFKTYILMSSFMTLIRTRDSMLFVPDSIKFLTYSLISYFRAEYYIRECSPNFYIGDNEYTGSTVTSTTISEICDKIPKGTVVLFKEASFSWVTTRSESMYSKNPEDANLVNINFELRRGDIVIVTGSQGSGKSNFIKSILGEMTLVGGSMAVVPLHTSMPIFYASQDVWLQQGTIRSNITFGHRFDENIYNTVLKAVELKSDISTWEKGDLRVVSNYAHSLSGGQRVRMEMARAIYAYLIFNEVNTKYNNGQCSFLMCIDGAFNALDPYVIKNTFSNLFALQSGILVKEDLSVILSASKRFFEAITLREGLYANISLYQIKDRTLEKLRDIFSITQPLDVVLGSDKLMSLEPPHMIKMCESEELNPGFRGRFVKENYDDSLIIDPESKKSGRKFRESFKPYIIYFKSTGILFLLFLVFTTTYLILDTCKYVITGKLGDDIMELVDGITPSEYYVVLVKIRKLCDDSLLKIKKLTAMVVAFCFLANAVLTFTCVRGCKRLHEYCINSIINNSSSVIRIKSFSSEILTFLSSDIFMIDENFGPCLSSVVILFVYVLIMTFTLGYYFPMCLPMTFIFLITIGYFIFRQFIYSSKNLQIASLESLSRNNFVCEKAVSSSSTYRSFKKERTLLDSVMEYTDYCIRSWFYSKSFLSWASFVAKFIFLIMTLFNFLAPIVYIQFKTIRSFIGTYGLNLMQNLRVVFVFTSLVAKIARLEMLMCSIKRFECFIPPGQKCVFDKYRNVHVEDVVMNNSIYSGLSGKQVKKSLLLRRRNEFKEENVKFYSIRKLGFRPRINVLDLNQFLSPDHFGVELKDVHVYTSPELNKDGAILKGITASAYKSDIIGIIGRTGSGKTTLLTVLENTARYRTGQVLLDGTDLKDIPKNVIRHIIGVLPQLPFVFKGWTVRRFLDPRKLFSDDEINQALDMCGLLQFVNDLQGGKKLDSILVNEHNDPPKHKSETSKQPDKDVTTGKSEKSSSLDTLQTCDQESEMLLTGSQLRTLSFARLVLYRYLYRMILVDEPPSENYDTDDQTKTVSDSRDFGIPIYELLKRYFQHCTTFVTAHDSTTLRACNSVWILHHGSFVGKCGIEEILKDNSISNIIERYVKN